MYDNTITATQSEACERLKEKIKELESVNHMMAHNLRGAASNIKLLSEILMDQQPKVDENESVKENELTSQEIATYLQQSSSAMLNTLDNMMEVVNNKLNNEMQPDECDVQQIIDNVTDQLNGVIACKGVHIMLHLAIKKVKCAKVYLESVFYNMISNAIKYARPDVPLQLEICSYNVQGRPMLEFKDNGSGIDMNKVGNKLFKLNQVFHQDCESKGVGLFITKRQVERLGGCIKVSSEVNQGTRFCIML